MRQTATQMLQNFTTQLDPSVRSPVRRKRLRRDNSIDKNMKLEENRLCFHKKLCTVLFGLGEIMDWERTVEVLHVSLIDNSYVAHDFTLDFHLLYITG